MADQNIKIIGLKELKMAVKRHPDKIKKSAQTYLVRSMAVYRSGIINDPWRVGGKGGGAPVSNDPRYQNKRNKKSQKARSGNFRDTHVTDIQALRAMIGPNEDAAPYAAAVHDGSDRGLKARPWLEYVKEDKDSEIQKLERDMLRDITNDLAS